MRRWGVRAPFLAVAAIACTDQPDRANGTGTDEREALINYLEAPQYGVPVRLRGVVGWGFETSSIDICDNASGPCVRHRNVDGAAQNCWLELAPSAANDLPREHLDGNFLIELTGRVATLPGLFGHLGEHSCQIEALRIHSLRTTGAGLAGETPGPELVTGGRTEQKNAPTP